jgi:hypothetical protein
MGAGDHDVFGSIIVATEVEDALKATIEEWAPTYLRFLERHLGKEPMWLPNFRSYVVTSDFDHWPEEQLPAILIISPEINKPAPDGNKDYRADFPINVGVFAAGNDRSSSEKLVKYYGAALRALLLQKGNLGGIATATVWDGEKFDVHVPEAGKRTVGTAEIELTTEVRQVVRRLGGPSEPLPPPEAEPSPWPLVEHVTPVKLDPEDL